MLALFACTKKEIDTTTLNNNPFDQDYTGPSVFILDTTYAETVITPGGPILQQVIAFHVDHGLLLNSAAYQVKVYDPAYDQTTVLSPTQVGSDHFKYPRFDALPNVPVCIRLQLFNNQSAARADQLCATLQ